MLIGWLTLAIIFRFRQYFARRALPRRWREAMNLTLTQIYRLRYHDMPTPKYYDARDGELPGLARVHAYDRSWTFLLAKAGAEKKYPSQ